MIVTVSSPEGYRVSVPAVSRHDGSGQDAARVDKAGGDQPDNARLP
jgi:cobalamin biosynthesis protein CbiD